MSCIRLLLLIITVLSLVFSSGCTDDLLGGKLFDDGVEEVVLRFSVENVTLSRDSGDEGIESRIDHAYLLFYPEDAIIGSSTPIAAVRAEVSQATPNALTFKMPLRLEPSIDYQLMALANADEYTPAGFGSFAEYLQSWSAKTPGERGELQLFHAECITPDNTILPMLGKISDNSTFSFLRQNGGYQVSASISFRRMVSRIDIANMKSQGFLIEGVALCNWRNTVSVTSMLNDHGNRAGSICGLLSDDGNNAGDVAFKDMPDADENGIQQLQQVLYCFPSVCYDSYASDQESTALLIKAKYEDDEESSYYRVNVGVSGNKAEVKANTKYLVAIQSVKGSGASTAEEAYSAEESPIMLSEVEDWDLEGSFDMDEKGNFLLVSTGRMEFEGDEVENREVRVLTSRGLGWNIEYTAEDDASEIAFQSTRLSDTSLAIGPTGKNNGETSLMGRFTVTATTSEGGILKVEIAVSQKSASEESDVPNIPNDMPFALIPESDERVRIDHINRTIEIDGFAPECFNSFIDIPFKVYIKDAEESPASLEISTTLEWPCEGRIAVGSSSSYFYCKESFNTQGAVLDGSGNSVSFNTLYNNRISISKDNLLNISVGAMGPDDPAIIRNITLSGNHEEVTYCLTVKPRPCIIDDVVLSNASGESWMIMDRNVQILTGYDWSNPKFIGRDALDHKRQAYNYCNQSYLRIPFKNKSLDETFSEDMHFMYRGWFVTFSSKSQISTTCKNWLSYYKTTSVDLPSPCLYDEENIYSWGLPDAELLQLCSERMRVSKMRLYLISELVAKEDGKNIPICCYWPYMGDGPNEKAWPRHGYYITEPIYSYLIASSIKFIFYNGTEVKVYSWNVNSDDYGFTRLVRSLTAQELEDYKNNYLGYGSQPHRLSICHPDTYESIPLGWLSY